MEFSKNRVFTLRKRMWDGVGEGVVVVVVRKKGNNFETFYSVKTELDT